MILVDTSVWVDYLRGQATPADKTIDKVKLHDSAFSGGVEISVK